MAIRYPITLSTTEPNNDVGLLKIRQADEETQTLVVDITANGQPKSYEGLQPFFCAKLGQSIGLGIVEQKLNPEEMTNPKAGQLEYTFRAEDWQQIGRQVGYFSFRKMKDDGHEYVEQLTTRDFYFNVTKNIFSEGLTEVKKDGSTYVWTIEDLIRLFNEYIASGKSDWEEFVDQNREVLESVDPGGLILSELIRSRKPEGAETPYPDLPTRLDEQIGKNNEFREFESEKSFMARVKNEQVERGINIRWFGAIGDGFSDCFTSFQSALEYCSENKIKLIIPKGVYNLNPANDNTNQSRFLFIYSNTKIEIDKEAILYMPNVMLVASATGFGYSGGVSNVEISGGTIKGDFDVVGESAYYNGRFSSAWHHARNLKFENIHFEACVSDSHCFDFSGCSDILIKNCAFKGIKPSRENREYVECIQLDSSFATGLSFDEGESEFCDGLPTINVTVENCKFLPMKNDDGTIEYYAPCPIGNHSELNGTDPIKNIVFKNNYVEDVISSATVNFWIHFTAVEELRIETNTFVHSDDSPACCIKIAPGELIDWDGTALSNTKYCRDIYIKNNVLKNFGKEDYSAAVIDIGGNPEVLTENVEILGNNIFIENDYFSDGSSGGQDCILLKNIKDISIKKNRFSNQKKCLLTSWNDLIENLTFSDNEVYLARQHILAGGMPKHLIFENNKIFDLIGACLSAYSLSTSHPNNGAMVSIVLFSNNFIGFKASKTGDITSLADSNLNNVVYVSFKGNIVDKNGASANVKLNNNSNANVLLMDSSGNSSPEATSNFLNNSIKKSLNNEKIQNKFTYLFQSGAGIKTGDITLNQDIRNFSYVLVQTGYTGGGTLKTHIIAPASMADFDSWKIGETYASELGTMKLNNFLNLTINFSMEVRAIVGVS